MVDLRRRRDNGQHHLAALALKIFPRNNLSADVMKELADLERELENARNRLDRVRLVADDAAANVDRGSQADRVGSMRSAVRDDFDAVGLERLDAFLKLENDNSLTSEQKLALAYSGWMLGSAYAVTDLDQTLRYWQARHLIEEYLVTQDAELPTAICFPNCTTWKALRRLLVSRMLVWLKPLWKRRGSNRAWPAKLKSKMPTPMRRWLTTFYCPRNTRPTGPIR